MRDIHPAVAGFRTAFGWCAAATRSGRVIRVVLPHGTLSGALRRLGTLGREAAGEDRLLRAVAEGIARYFRGERVTLRFRLDLSVGTPFQRAVWRATLAISYGQCRSYGQVAALAGRPGAGRAAGQALAANPLPILVPCHRVVASDGSPGGFMGGRGSRLKSRMLGLEAMTCQRRRARHLRLRSTLDGRPQMPLPRAANRPPTFCEDSIDMRESSATIKPRLCEGFRRRRRQGNRLTRAGARASTRRRMP